MGCTCDLFVLFIHYELSLTHPLLMLSQPFQIPL